MRSHLCAQASDPVSTPPQTLPNTLLDPAIRAATPTPTAYPLGSHARFCSNGRMHLVLGAHARRDAKPLKLTRGADSSKAPSGRSTHAGVMDRGPPNVLPTCRSHAVAARKERPRFVR
jgi:hypothetical protein